MELFKLVDEGFHKNVTWPSDEAYKNKNGARWPTPFCLLHYSKPEQYPDGAADVAGYWAEDRIFGGVVPSGRSTTINAYVPCPIPSRADRGQITSRSNVHPIRNPFADIASLRQFKYDGIWFHSHREDVTKRIYKLTEEQSTSLLQFHEKKLSNESICPLPILGDINKRLRVDEGIASPEFNIYRDRWERTVDYLGTATGMTIVPRVIVAEKP